MTCGIVATPTKRTLTVASASLQLRTTALRAIGLILAKAIELLRLVRANGDQDRTVNVKTANYMQPYLKKTIDRLIGVDYRKQDTEAYHILLGSQ